MEGMYILLKAADAINRAKKDLENASRTLGEVEKQIALFGLLPEKGRDNLAKELAEEIDIELSAANLWQVGLALSQLKEAIEKIIQKRVVIEQKKEDEE
jgi:hypothetical protein